MFAASGGLLAPRLLGLGGSSFGRPHLSCLSGGWESQSESQNARNFNMLDILDIVGYLLERKWHQIDPPRKRQADDLAAAAGRRSIKLNGFEGQAGTWVLLNIKHLGRWSLIFSGCWLTLGIPVKVEEWMILTVPICANWWYNCWMYWTCRLLPGSHASTPGDKLTIIGPLALQGPWWHEPWGQHCWSLKEILLNYCYCSSMNQCSSAIPSVMFWMDAMSIQWFIFILLS